MDPITVTAIIKTTTTIIKYGDQVIKYIRDDQTAKLGLLAPVRIVIEGPGVGIGCFKSPDGLFSFVSPSINRIEFKIIEFPADERSWWNGPDGIPNTWGKGAVPGSLVHDGTCQFRKLISGELGITVDEVWVWSSGILSTVWDYYGGDTSRSNVETWIAYNITRNLRRPYEWAKRRLGLSLVVIAAMLFTGCLGCHARPDWHVTEADPIISIESGIVTTNTPPIILN